MTTQQIELILGIVRERMQRLRRRLEHLEAVERYYRKELLKLQRGRIDKTPSNQPDDNQLISATVPTETPSHNPQQTHYAKKHIGLA